MKKRRKHKGFTITIAITIRVKIEEREDEWKIYGKYEVRGKMQKYKIS